jgi:hypothetical protein
MSLDETHWDADVERLAAALGVARPRAVWPWALGGAAAAALAVGAVCMLRPKAEAPMQATAGAASAAASSPAPLASAAATADASARLPGTWAADVRYPWGARHTERFEFKRHAGQITGTASFTAYPIGIENFRVDGNNLHFETRSQESVGDKTYDVVHRYSAELRGEPPDEVLAIRMHSTGGFGGSRKPLEFEARRATGGKP